MKQKGDAQQKGSGQPSLLRFFTPKQGDKALKKEEGGAKSIEREVENRLPKRQLSPCPDIQDENRPPKKPRTEAGSARKSLMPKKEEKNELSFLDPKHIKDRKGRRPDDPEYDGSTVYVPQEYLSKVSAGMRQWWKFKSEGLYDTILFFKMGKFYELYFDDATLAIEVLGLTKMGGANNTPHCGFPEASCERHARQLILRGYKVARVEQTETPEQLKERNKSATTSKNDKVVRRELCQIQSISTAISFGGVGVEEEIIDKGYALPKLLMAIVEERVGVLCSSYGVCFVDCSTGKFSISQFNDDESQSSLRTLLAHNPPAELLYERGSLTKATMTILKTVLANVSQQAMPPKGFMSPEDVLGTLAVDRHLGSVDTWPDSVRSAILDPHSVLPSDYIKHLRSKRFVNMQWIKTLRYLKRCLIDADMTSMRLFSIYTPPTHAEPAALQVSKTNWENYAMVLDGTSLLNLHVLPPTAFWAAQAKSPKDQLGEVCSSLLATIDTCSTAFGRRLLREWISAPTCDPAELGRRQTCVRYLAGEGKGFMAHASRILAEIPDMAKLFQRVHSNSMQYRATEHPDARANFFGDYGKRRVKCFVSVLDGLQNIGRIVKLYRNGGYPRSALLDSLLGQDFPDFAPELQVFLESFDRQAAMDSGTIAPKAGLRGDYDLAVAEVENAKAQLGEYLADQKRVLKCNVKYTPGYQLEVPDAISLGKKYMKATCTKKGVGRYSTSELEALKEQLDQAEAGQETIRQKATKELFAKFDASKNKWALIVRNMALLDALFSLANYACKLLDMETGCFPAFDFSSTEPFLEIANGIHPCFTSSRGFVPNSCLLGTRPDEGDGEPAMLLTGACSQKARSTGPNMGGKSTVMRMVSLLTVLAQIGSMVPAKSMRLTPCDRIFCRIGASDRLSAGQSTFYVELAETNVIMKQATRNSLVLIDELGRGTSTYDGLSIAAAVLKYVATRIRCRMIFSTHYHSLCKMIEGKHDVKLAHMDYTEVSHQGERRHEALSHIKFRYILRPGPCLKSYGYHTARLSGISEELIVRAYDASKKYLRMDGASVKTEAMPRQSSPIEVA